MKIHNTSSVKKIKKFKILNIHTHYNGSWVDEPYFQIYTLSKRVRVMIWKFKIFKYESKITEHDYSFIMEHSWEKLGQKK